MTEAIKEYSQALFTLAQEEGIVEEISASLDAVKTIFTGEKEYMDFLSAPNISKAERVRAIDEAFTGNINEYVVSLLSLLCERDRIKEIYDLINYYRDFCDIANRISVAEVTSAVELNEKEKSALKVKLEKICGNQVILNCETDETLLGGIIVRVDGKIIDGSIRHKLHELKGVMNG